MRADFKRDVNHSYLILYGPDEVNTSGYQTRMLLCNHFSALLPCKIQSMDGQSLFYYEITSHQSFSERYEKRKIGREEMQMFFQGIIQAVQELGSYLLEADNLVLEPAFIYLEGDLNRIHFCYLPGYARRIGEQFLGLTEYLLPKIDHQDHQAVALGYGMYRVAMEEEFQIDRIKEELYRKYEREQEKGLLQEERMEYGEALPEPDFFQNQKSEYGGEEESDSIFLREKPSQGKTKWLWEVLAAVTGILVLLILFLAFHVGRVELAVILGGFAVLMGIGAFLFWMTSRKEKPRPKEFEEERKTKEDYCEAEEKGLSFDSRQEKCEKKSERSKGEPPKEECLKSEKKPEELPPQSQLTMVLSEAAAGTGSSLISKEEGRLPAIFLDQDLLIIGKLNTVSDVILPYPTVSRVHSKIRRIQGEYYLTDLNSRNGTFVNGRMLQAGEEYLLQDQDEVRFADLSYIFLK